MAVYKFRSWLFTSSAHGCLQAPLMAVYKCRSWLWRLVAFAENCGTNPDPGSASRQLVLQTALGAAEMALQSSHSAGELRKKVTSPGGTTAAALTILEERGLETIFADAVSAARKRSEELSDI